MSFFQNIAQMGLNGTLKVVINTEGDNMVVSVMLDNQACGDNARKHITPLLLKGSAAELDEGFFTTIEKPLKQSSGLMVNMESYVKSQEEAKKQSQQEQDSANKVKKEKDDKKKKYDTAMKKVDELAKEKKYKTALAALPSAIEHPDQSADILAKHREISKHISQISIFDTAALQQAEAPETTETAEADDNSAEETENEEE